MAAALRLPRSMSASEKEAAADALIRRLGLTGSADTPVGEQSALRGTAASGIHAWPGRGMSQACTAYVGRCRGRQALLAQAMRRREG